MAVMLLGAALTEEIKERKVVAVVAVLVALIRTMLNPVITEISIPETVILPVAAEWVALLVF